MHAEFSVVAKVQLNREASKPVQETPCKYTGFMFSINPPLAAMAPGNAEQMLLILSVIMSYHSLVKEHPCVGRTPYKFANEGVSRCSFKCNDERVPICKNTLKSVTLLEKIIGLKEHTMEPLKSSLHHTT